MQKLERCCGVLFFPKMYQKDIFSINYDHLYQQGIRALFYDLDNTVGLLAEEHPSDATKKLFSKLSKQFHLAIISNHSSRERVQKFADDLGCISFHYAMKPSTRALRKAQKKFQCSKSEILMIGDQLITDIFAANRFQVASCLVEPMSSIDLKITGLNRMIERKILKFYEKKNIMKIGEYYG